MDVAKLLQLLRRFHELSDEATQALVPHTRVGYLAAVEKYKESALVADLIGGAEGADRRADSDRLVGRCLFRLGNMAAAAHAACSSLRAARASGRRTALVTSLITCSTVAHEAPDVMVKAERESREQERRDGFPSYGGLDLTQEGKISLPTSPAALARLGLMYMEAAVATCDTALAAAGGRDNPADGDDDERRVPSLRIEAEARGALGVRLGSLNVERQRSLELLRQAVELLRRAVRMATPGVDTLEANRLLATWLSNLGCMLDQASGMAEAAACQREALKLSEKLTDVRLKQGVLINLANMSGRPDQPVGLAEAAALRSRLNALYAQAGRSTDTSCMICLEPLEQPGGGAEQEAIGDGGRGADGFANAAVFVLQCGHQFHRGCLSTWWRTAASQACPLCKT